MKLLLTLCFAMLVTAGISQSAEKYFNKIRNNEAALTAFFSAMPKGGDLHHHYSGSVYAETFLQYAIAQDFYVNTETLKVEKEKPSSGTWEQFSNLQRLGQLDLYKQKIMQRWSVKDYNNVDYPSDKLFFESFNKFDATVFPTIQQGLTEIKNRALKENVSYIETQLTDIPCNINSTGLNNYNAVLRRLAAGKDQQHIFQMLDTLSTALIKQGAASCAENFESNMLQKLHTGMHIDSDSFTMRYQSYVLRFMEPVDIFKNLLMCFIAAEKSKLITGVNIVSSEDGETSMKDYWLHMIMFRYCNSRYPSVKYSLHAGELTLGLVKPEELTWHIRAAVYTAKANRIGHGVDVAYEDSCYDLLRYMGKNKIAVEINLASNEFILKVKEGRHPITLYKKFGVPIVISTDDAGVLRTNLIEQFVLLAKRYKEFSYKDIKQLVYNSINYSFIKEPEVKRALLKDLDNRFIVFESAFSKKEFAE